MIPIITDDPTVAARLFESAAIYHYRLEGDEALFNGTEVPACQLDSAEYLYDCLVSKAHRREAEIEFSSV